jgi:hypothetical protein
MGATQMRSIHERGYTNYDDHNISHFHEVNMALMNCKNTPNMVFLF